MWLYRYCRTVYILKRETLKFPWRSDNTEDLYKLRLIDNLKAHFQNIMSLNPKYTHSYIDFTYTYWLANKYYI